jgi:hypothetical protein
MNRITLNVICGPFSVPTVLDYLRKIIPPWAVGVTEATLPEPPYTLGRYSPWGRLAEFRGP